MFNRQVHSSKERDHHKPNYSREWLTKWCLDKSLFHKLYDNWVMSNYDKNLTPSCDRIFFKKPYLKDNIQLMTWKENNAKSHLEIKSMRNENEKSK
jgi:hypothetical protein